MSFTSSLLAVQEISRIDPSVALMLDIHNTLTINAIRRWGSSELQSRWLPRLAQNTVSSFALSETGSGSDAFALRTRAVPASGAPPGSHTLHGTKAWISNAREAGVFLVFANADPAQGHRGITAFLVDAARDGVEVGPPERKLGLRANSTCPVAFDGVRVDACDVLGEVGMGYRYCMEILNEGRIGIGAQQVGIALGCLDVAMPYLLERTQFDSRLADFQPTRSCPANNEHFLLVPCGCLVGAGFALNGFVGRYQVFALKLGGGVAFGLVSSWSCVR